MSRNFVVTVKESADGTPWLLVEPHEDIGLQRTQNITMRLAAGATYEQAQQVASYLNKNVAKFRISRF
jgi:hypothetical protein